MVPNTIISKPKLQMTYVIWGEFLSFWVHSYWTLLDDNGLAWWIRDPGAFGRFDWESPQEVHHMSYIYVDIYIPFYKVRLC